AGINRLYTVNLATGVTTLVANIASVNTGSPSLNIDIAIDRTGQMYGFDIVTDQFYRIDKTNGNVTALGAGTSGFNANFAQGMAFDWAPNTLYATIYPGGGTGVFASVNTATGVATSLASTTAWNAEMEMAVRAAVPEPVSSAILAAAGIGFCR